MSALRRQVADSLDVTAFTRRAGATSLLAVGGGNAVLGLWLAWAANTGLLVRMAFSIAGAHTRGAQLLARAPRFAWYATDVATVVGVLLLVVGLLQLLAGWWAFDARRWRAAVAAAGTGVLSPLTAPLALVALTLLALSADQFRGEVTR